MNYDFGSSMVKDKSMASNAKLSKLPRLWRFLKRKSNEFTDTEDLEVEPDW